MRCRIWLLTAGWLCGLVPQFVPSTEATAAEQPNVLFIAVDDLNDWIGCLGGHPDGQSPAIDRLAASGMLFTHAYCAAPACNPSRAALLTGVRPWTSGVYVNPQPWRPAMPDVITLPQLFRQQGYHVVGAGKIFHGGYNDPKSWDDYQEKGGDPKPQPKVAQDPHSRAGGIIWGRLAAEDQQMADYRTVTYAVDYLSEKHDRPFFLACGIYRPHMPWQVPSRYYDMFPVDQVRLPKILENDLSDVPEAGIRMARPQGDHATIRKTQNWKHAVQAYLASIRFADGQVGRLIEALRSSDYSRNTIIVLWGDHGWHLGEKQHWRKFALWEEATRAPLLFVVPGVTQPGQRCPATVDFMNVYPTLCELCQLPKPAGLDGHSMVSLLRDPQSEWQRPAITTHGRGNHAVRTAAHRYIRYEDGSEELYDHRTDPDEWHNLASDPNTVSLRHELANWLPRKEAPNAAFDPKRAGGRKQGSRRKGRTISSNN